MAITYFQPEVWSSSLLSVLSKSLVYGGAPCVNRDYEGEIQNAGDTVHIVSVADPTISDYTKDTDLTVQVLTDAEQTLTITQAKAFAFEIDDIDRRQVASGGALMSEAAQRAAFGLADKTDQYLAGLMALSAGNALGIVDATTVTNVYDKLLVPARVKLNQANVPTAGRFMVIDPATEGQILLDSRFIKANEAGTDNGLRNGYVGRAAGFDIYTSNNAPQANRALTSVTTASGAKTLTGVAGQFNQGDVGLSVTGTGVGASAKVVSVNADGSVATVDVNSSASAAVTVTLAGGGQLAIAGSRIATSYAEQISKVEAFRPEKRFADALKGLHLYGGKVTRPSALVIASVKVA
jgi:hypothetical protein